MTVRDGIGRACFHAISAENAPRIIDVVHAGVAFAGGDAVDIDYSRCIFCGYCVEACPTDAITHGHGFELATYDINSLVYRKEQLLEIGTAAATSSAR